MHHATLLALQLLFHAQLPLKLGYEEGCFEGARDAHDARASHRLLKEEAEAAAALREKDAAEDAERQRLRASVRGALKMQVCCKC